MKRSGRFVALVVMASLLALQVRAGHMETTVTVTPTPTPAVASDVQDNAPAVGSGESEGQEASAGTLAEVTVTLLQTVLSLF